MLPKLRNVLPLPSILFLLLSFLLTNPSYAQDAVTTLSAQDILQRISDQLPYLWRLVTAVAYVLGMFFLIRGVLKLKEFGEQRSMMSQEHSLKGPLIYLVIGALLLYLPSTFEAGLSTFWAEPNPYGYLQQQTQWAQVINVCYRVVQFIGVLAFIRGLVILSSLGGHGAQQNTFGKGLTHIIGGIFCINIYQFVQAVLYTLGVTVQT